MFIDHAEAIAEAFPAAPTGWDCCLDMRFDQRFQCAAEDTDLNEENAETDWQQIVLDRFHDRQVAETLFLRDGTRW